MLQLSFGQRPRQGFEYLELVIMQRTEQMSNFDPTY